MQPTFTFSAQLWEPPVEPAWVFATLPADQSDEIGDLVPSAPGFGSVKVAVTIGETEWKTSLFPSSRAAAYVLPVKRAVRDRERLEIGDTATITVRILLDG